MLNSIRTVLALSLTLVGVSTAAVAAPPPAQVVFPTGDFPADVQNVQAAVDVGGIVLLKATNVAGQPLSFNYGPAVAGSGTVHLTQDVTIIGETVAGNATTIIGGNIAFRSYVPLRAEIRGIFFDGQRVTAAHVRASTGFKFSDNHVARTIPFFDPAFGFPKVQGLWIEGSNLTGPILIEDNLFEDTGWADAGYGVAVFSDGAPVRIAGNTILGAGFAGILASAFSTSGRPTSEPIVIEDNYIEPGPFDPEAPNSGVGIWIVGNFTDAPMTVRGNEVFCENPFADGVVLFGSSQFYGPLRNVLVEKNHITMRGSIFGAITLADDVSETVVSNNRIDGDAAFGLDIVAVFADAFAVSNTFVGNNQTNLQASTAAVFLDVISRDTVVVGKSGTVIDLGDGNQITGFSKIGHGEHIGPQVSKRERIDFSIPLLDPEEGIAP
jgi:hypothetical protein